MLYEGILAVAVGVGFIVWSESGGSESIGATLHGNRAQMYGSLASLAGALLGFSITSIAVVIGYSTAPRLRIIRESGHMKTVWRTFFSAIVALGMLTIAALVALIFDNDSDPSMFALYAVVLAVSYSFLRVARAVWVLQLIISILSDTPRTGTPSSRQG